MTTRPLLPGAALLAALATGCSQPPVVVPARGVVVVNGQPLPNAEVRFVPTRPGVGMEFIATATTDDKGRFELTCNGQPGACAGENRVTVAEAPMPEKYRGRQSEEAKYAAGLKNRPIPDTYINLARTPLTVSVAADRDDYAVELKR